MLGIMNGDSCWTCNKALLPAIGKRPKRDPIVYRSQLGPRYCESCVIRGRTVKERRAPVDQPRPRTVAEFHEAQRLLPLARRAKNRLRRSVRDRRIKERRAAKAMGQ